MNKIKNLTEQQAITVNNLTNIIRVNGSLQDDKLLNDLYVKSKNEVHRNLTCIHVMFILEQDIFNYKWEHFYKEFTDSIRGLTVSSEYYKVWDLYTKFFRNKLYSDYMKTMTHVKRESVKRGYNFDLDENYNFIIPSLGHSNIESLMIHNSGY